ncbi:hypothetical protein Calag_1473 [Caldisphaera lagunensis DSM 15908]|uniref:Uncharacterized protein n=1 Tax=Caldisphaera lagunensis (strain DSM 15908 / JCM 11604 / ANMR 0165 / IC-154) TaxID=1056495 RepID=L0ADQ8_CALLD|nr:hypothetical protein [Caldisphaera lagunensis]AFZ71175.1 hypothetical protein Calag_1473 [Caldisphaera lagunensis DSM 15908]
MSASSGKLSIGEEVYLRGLTGRLVGIYLFKGFNKVAILTYPDRICESISSAAAVSYLDSYGYSENKVKIFDYSENIDDIIKSIIDWNPDAIYLAFGGEQRLVNVNDMTIKVLNSLYNHGYKGNILIHVRVWLATKQLSTILSNNELKEYLRSVQGIRLFTADANLRKFMFNYVLISKDGKVTLNKYAETDITQEHADLLKLSLPPS